MNARISSTGRIAIPHAMQERYGLMPGTDVEFVERDGWIGIRRVDMDRHDQVEALLTDLTGSGIGELSTDEIMELSRGYSADA